MDADLIPTRGWLSVAWNPGASTLIQEGVVLTWH